MLATEQWHKLRDHLTAVGARAGASAGKFGAADFAGIAGLLHDVGKYSSEFQRRLCGEGGRVDHSTAGARIAIERYGAFAGKLIAYAIAGHHAGLANESSGQDRSALKDRLALRPGLEIPSLDPAWMREVDLPQPPRPKPFDRHPDCRIARQRQGFQLSVLVRMLFSCLVDADYLDTEAWHAAAEGRTIDRGNWPSPSLLKPALARYLQDLAGVAASGDVNALRADVLSAARKAAEHSPGLFSLTVPTGGGKTLSGLAFALEHAVRWQLQRVIYVAPFTSVIEQNAAVFRSALAPFEDAVIEHHSAFRDDEVPRDRTASGEGGLEAGEKLKLAMENWDAPIIATTAVQFFESLFAATPAKCRKLHNIARSVVILDEAQTLPLSLLEPCVAAIDELARNYGTSIVLCTATQPALEDRGEGSRHSFRGGLRNIREIAPDPKHLFGRLRRVRVEALAEPLEDEALVEKLRECDQVLCIVNSRGHARAVFEGLRDAPGARHLSTWMCAANRARVLAAIRADLAAGRPCRVVSTSLIEAGVDVDFPCVFRAEAGLDSIAQAAGRCNREGRRAAADSPVFVFRPVGWKPPVEIEQYAAAMRTLLRRHKDLLSPDAIEDYFREVYWLKSTGRDNALDARGILEQLNARCREFSFPFEDVARAFHIIEDGQQPVLVPFDATARGLIEELRHARSVGSIARKLQRYVVPLHPHIFAGLAAAAAIAPVRDDPAGRQFYALENDDLYCDEVGLVWDDPEFRRIDRLII